MDKNNIIGLSIIAVILATFTYLNRPSEEELKAQKEKQATELALQKEKAHKEVTKKANKEHKVAFDTKAFIPKMDANKQQIQDEAGNYVYFNTLTKRDTAFAEVLNQGVAPAAKVETIKLENEKLIVEISTKGAILQSVYLKEFQKFDDFKRNADSITPLQMFAKNDNINQIVYPINGKNIQSSDLNFSTVNKTDKSLILETTTAEGQKIQFSYFLKDNAYDIDFDIKLEGFAGKVASENVRFKWASHLAATERSLKTQRMVSTVYFKEMNDKVDYLSEASNDSEELEENIDWIAYKQSYFSTILRPVNGFGKAGSTVKINKYAEGGKRDSLYIKYYQSDLQLNLSSDYTAKMNWYFGPNDYETLKAHGDKYENILNYGWGLFRWINEYVIQPIFNVLSHSGLNYGIIILIITLIVKLVLTPVQWKMFVSSAKMKILKPEVDALNAKYPKQEDAMKKQMEMMTIYRESGASPMASCLPMLLQMPILIAVFRFFPATFELRQKPFLWAEDLSSYDSIFNLGFEIPFYGSHVSLFTLLMAITTLVYTHLNSSNMQQPTQPGMPNMKVIMYIMPVMMIFFFNNYSAGLSYYYFISTLVSILTMLAIKHFFVDEEKLKAKMQLKKSEAKTGTKKKSKFQERLEEMQRIQQEAQKNKKK